MKVKLQPPEFPLLFLNAKRKLDMLAKTEKYFFLPFLAKFGRKRVKKVLIHEKRP
jgi:hypothetical protein